MDPGSRVQVGEGAEMPSRIDTRLAMSTQAVTFPYGIPHIRAVPA
jgi:hypothetical protein